MKLFVIGEARLDRQLRADCWFLGAEEREKEVSVIGYQFSVARNR